MHDDDAMDRLLKMALAQERPGLSPGFDARLVRRLRPRRLTQVGRAAIGVYALAAVGLMAWLMHDLPVPSIAVGVALCTLVAVSASAYAKGIA